MLYLCSRYSRRFERESVCMQLNCSGSGSTEEERCMQDAERCSFDTFATLHNHTRFVPETEQLGLLPLQYNINWLEHNNNLTQWKLSLSTNAIISHYGLPLLYTIASLAATRSCLLVYLSLLRLVAPSSLPQHKDTANSTEARVSLYFITEAFVVKLESPHQLHSVRHSLQ